MKHIIYEGIEIGINCFQSIIVMYFAYKYLGDKQGRSFIQNGGLLFAFVFTVFLTIVNSFTAFEDIVMIFYILFVLVYAVWKLHGSIGKKIFAAAYQVICICLISVVTANFYARILGISLEKMLTEQTVARMIALMTTQMMILYVYQLSIRILNRHKDGILQKQEWALIILMLILGTVEAGLLNVVSLYHAEKNTGIVIALIVSCIVLVNIAAVFLVTDLGRKNRAMQENKALKLQHQYQQDMLRQAKEEYERIRKIRHDYKNTFQVVYTLLESGKQQDAKDYIQQNIERIAQTGLVVHTNNDIVNAIVSSKILTAHQQGIETSFVSVADFAGVDVMDMSTILGNLYDNAIEACVKCEPHHRNIDTQIVREGEKYIISMKNTIHESVLGSNKKLETTKPDKEKHGLGTRIIQDYVRRNHGIYDYYEEDGYFCSLIVLEKVR